MVEIKSIEQLLHFMKGHIHLSRYDEKFIDNLTSLKQVTTNQVVLLHTLIFKYKRQFIKHELFVEKLVDLPWNVTVVESSPQYTDGHASLENNTLFFKCPFNRNFIDEFRKIPNNQFQWNKDKRQYEAPYNQYTLKILLDTAPKFFNTINLCTELQKMIAEVRKYEGAIYWNPTLVELQDRLYIAGINASLNDALGDIELNTELQTLARLSSFGITIPKELYSNTVEEKIAANSIVEVEHSEIGILVSTLKKLDCDMVYLSGAGLLNLAKKKIIESLKDADIPYTDTSVSHAKDIDYKYPVLIKLRKNFGSNYDPCKLAKMVYVVNSLPIDIK